MKRVKDISGLFDLVKETAESHLGIKAFDWGTSLDFTQAEAYPMLYLELPFSIEESGEVETCSFAFNVVTQAEDRARIIERTTQAKQIAADIKNKLCEDLCTDKPASYLTFTDEGDDLCVGVRVDMTLTIARNTSPNPKNFRG